MTRLGGLLIERKALLVGFISWILSLYFCSSWTTLTSCNYHEYMSTSSNSIVSPINMAHTNDEPSEIELESSQDISGRHISPVKLIVMLRMKFGVGAYEIQVCSNYN